MRTYSTNYTVDLADHGELDCVVEFKCYPGHPGTWYRRNGDPGDPPEPAEIEVIRVTHNGNDYTDLCADSLADSDLFRDAAWEVYEAYHTRDEP